MKLGVMINDLTRSTLQGPMTEKYPFERRSSPERLRGKLNWDPEACIGCGLCEKDCPSRALELIVIDKKAKQFEMLYRVDRCTFCAQCVHNCRQACLMLSNEEWELAALSTDNFQFTFHGKVDVGSDVATASAAGD